MTDDTQKFKFELKGLDSTNGVFEGITAMYGNVDQGGDRIQPGAFTKTLSESGGRVPLMLDHDIPIGAAQVSDSQKGLRVQGTLNLQKKIGQETYSDLKFYKEHGVPFGMSFKYRTVKSFFDGPVRVLTELKLFESTLTLFPMNPEAMVEALKSDRWTSQLQVQIAELSAMVKRYSRSD